ncbi:MAG: MBL fold metallo-hydrolase [bacterium]|nr:MBL fold metallo-hydrolase [bacterium]
MSLTRRSFLNKSVAGGLAVGIASALGLPPSIAAAPAQHKPDPTTWDNNEFTAAWIGQSTVFINFHGVKIITDPVLYDYIGLPVFGETIGPRRLTDPALPIEEIPVPDIVLLSHAHMDHMDYASLAFLTERSPGAIDCITAFKTSDVIEDLKWKSLTELDWSQKHTLKGIQFDAIPVKHFGWRYPWEYDRSRGRGKTGRSYNGYLLRGFGRRVVFGGDTAYTTSFEKLAVLGGIDVAIMPIGAYQPWHSVHCTPEEAVEMAQMMQARHFLPMHCKTFRQGTENFNEPPKRLLAAMKNVTDIKLGYIEIGSTYTVPKV